MTKTILAILATFLIAIPVSAQTRPGDSSNDTGVETTAGAVPGTAEDHSDDDLDASDPRNKDKFDVDGDVSKNPDGSTSASASMKAGDTRAEAGVNIDSDRDADSFASNRSTELPRTASPLPLIALGGLASLFGATAVNRTRKQ